ncbi:HTH-type transcriptional regulator HdfR [Xenorhabdus szentirmaii]|uniref:HTH-type transcriptional regulator HdfR n=2 Tax=Xenorhabdus szentirmaii TaxID=290112 RepID=W1J6X4_9GAMM|nr:MULTISPECIES: HTH-type transcriptional regulator HdfR [Xenorhabdus]MBD2780728.1 HTH-type transcriptional regulator HdfR [Xenorhabdus sp. 38]MBD2791904.1 HTH-type transcriptional regulator HdfR [Xenorhabdus sp. CUL]MBD2800597.1 HTH-type transcriptional regulator HdfR [Xenorhabdus sp. M]MBD2803814.1 HTH-type transcriptional regulator HdfR [Xenorhabdus sp. ZM]MBD2819644.1 HTH-type transcriptional regulator HdfR [Xenorhabdus sp. 42]
MDTELLKTFLEVSKTRHFGRAAESLYLTQSAVSFRIRQLENQLGTNLFTRHRNNIRLTAAGERLVPYAESLMNTWQLAKKEINYVAQHTKLSIGATASLWEGYLTTWLNSFYQLHQETRIETLISTRQSLVKQLHSRELDLLITTEPPKMDEFRSQLFGNIQLVLLTTQHNLENGVENYIKLEWGADFHQQEQKTLKSDHPPIITTTSAHIARELLNSVNAAAFLPVHWQDEYPQLVTSSANNEIIERPLYAVWLQNSDQQTFIQQLLKIPVEKAPITA